jgi:hypothetical protein
MQYQILSARSVDELQKKVQAMLEQGWRPTGGIAVSAAYSPAAQTIVREYFQAIVHGQ